MSNRDMIEKALKLNNVCEDDIVVIKTDTTTIFSIYLLRILVLLLLNFFLNEKMSEDEQIDFIMKNFNTILDIVITELEIELHNFTILYEDELTDIVELHNKDECLLVLVIQDKVNKKLKNIKERR